MPWRLDTDAGTTTRTTYSLKMPFQSWEETAFGEYFASHGIFDGRTIEVLGADRLAAVLNSRVVDITTPVTDDLLPVTVEPISDSENLPDFFQLWGPNFYAVSARFKELLTTFEPRPHSFYPVKGIAPTESGRDQNVFLFKTNNILKDAIIVEESDFKAVTIGGKISHYTQTKMPPRIVWRNSAIDQKHLWIDERAKSYVTVSNRLYEAMKKMGMTGFQAQESKVA